MGKLNRNKPMTDFFKTVRAYLRGKWWRRRVAVRCPELPFPVEIENEWRASDLREQIARLRRNKKKHSHLQKQLDDLLNGGADNRTKSINLIANSSVNTDKIGAGFIYLGEKE